MTFHRLFLIVPVSIACCVSACGASSATDSVERRLDVSQAAWTAARSGNSCYGYQVPGSKSYGLWAVTRIGVVEGRVLLRMYESYTRTSASDLPQPGEAWIEAYDEVGSHAGPAARAVTIDELYDVCRTDVLRQDPEANRIVVTYDSRGFLAECHYTPYECADDCTRGVVIENLNFSPVPLPPKPEK